MADDPRDQIDEMISDVERQVGILLTSYARQMLAIPLMERFEAGQRIDWPNVASSIFKILDEAKRHWRRPYEETSRRLNAVGIIRGFSAQFCNIPPFCGPTPRRRP